MYQDASDAKDEMSRSQAKKFQHDALFYSGLDDFVQATKPFVLAGVEGGEPVLVVSLSDRIDALRDSLDGKAADTVQFQNMEAVGRNPGAIISLWRDFIVSHQGSGPLRGIGEPVWAGRDPAELAECFRHEALINLAFQGDDASILCPYDTTSLPPEVLHEAERTHPTLVAGGQRRDADVFVGLGQIARPFDAPLTPPPVEAKSSTFDLSSLRAARHAASSMALRAGLSPDKQHAFTLAVGELLANSIRHGGGSGSLTVWADADRAWADISDQGSIVDPLAGRQRAPVGQPGGHGLWLVNQLCDLVQLRSMSTGVTVRVAIARGR